MHLTLSPFIISIVLDGEMLVWDPVTERHLPFGSLKTAALDKSQKELRPRPCCWFSSLSFDLLVDNAAVKIFDILSLNGVSLVSKTLRIRKGLMRKHVSEVQGRIEYVQEFIGKTAKDVRMRMDEIIENKSVHLVVENTTDNLGKGARD